MAVHRYSVLQGAEFRAVEAALRHVDRELPGRFRDALIDAARPAIQDAQTRVQSIPTHGTKHTGLRRRVARGVGIDAAPQNDPAYLRITTSMPEEDEAIIPRGLDRRAGWVHPVFGNRDVWVTQHTGGSWFRAAIEDHQDGFENGLTDQLEWAAEFVDEVGD